MKKLFAFLLTVLTTVCFAQVNVQINMPNPVDASTSNWTNGFVVTATSQKTYERCCLILTIKGPVNCGSLTPQSAPFFTLEANKPKAFNGQNAIALFGTNCVLTPGSYTLEATVYYTGKPLGTPATRQFEIKKEEPAAQVNLSINMPNPVDASTSNWTNGFVVTATTKKSVEQCCVILTIKGPVNCGTLSPPTTPSFVLRANEPKVFSGQNAIDLFGTNCILTPGSYMLYATVYINGKPQAPPASRPFEIRKEEPSNYQPPQAIAPADGTVIKEADAKKPVTFRWTPVTPKPREEVTYKLRIFEVKQGKTATAVVKSAAPMLEKEVKNQTQFVLPSLSQLNVAKSSSFAWTVQALDPKGNPFGGNNGISGINTLKIVVVGGTGCFKLDTTQYKIECAGMSPTGQIIYHVSNLILFNIGSGQGRTGLHDTPQTDVISPVGFSVNNLTPSGGAIINAGMSTSISFNIIGASGTTATFYVQGTVITDPDVYCDERIKATIDLPPCICNDCDSLTWEFGEPNATTQTPYLPNPNNTIYLSQSFSVTPYQIIKVKAEIINFRWYALNDCKRCNTNDYYWGNIINGTINNPGFLPNGFPPALPNGTLLPNSHEYNWATQNNQPKPFSGTLNLNISIPPQTELDCCKDCFRFCIRYSVTFIDDSLCKTCSIVKCYEIIRQHQPSLTLPINICGESNKIREQ